MTDKVLTIHKSKTIHEIMEKDEELYDLDKSFYQDKSNMISKLSRMHSVVSKNILPKLQKKKSFEEIEAHKSLKSSIQNIGEEFKENFVPKVQSFSIEDKDKAD